jgi:hypothetical protein
MRWDVVTLPPGCLTDGELPRRHYVSASDTTYQQLQRLDSGQVGSAAEF